MSPHSVQTLPSIRVSSLIALVEGFSDTDSQHWQHSSTSMHIAAANPISLDVDGVDPSELERERAVLVEQARASGKPENIIDKMVDGRIRKFYEEVVLLEQVWVIDNETKVRKAAENLGKELGTPVEIVGFIKFVIGEGIEKEKSDFAAEVAAQAGRYGRLLPDVSGDGCCHRRPSGGMS